MNMLQRLLAGIVLMMMLPSCFGMYETPVAKVLKRNRDEQRKKAALLEEARRAASNLRYMIYQANNRVAELRRGDSLGASKTVNHFAKLPCLLLSHLAKFLDDKSIGQLQCVGRQFAFNKYVSLKHVSFRKGISSKVVGRVIKRNYKALEKISFPWRNETFFYPESGNPGKGPTNAFATVLKANPELRLNTLKKLEAAGWNLVESHLVAIVQMCPNIEKFSYQCNEGLKDGFVAVLRANPASRLNALKELDAVSCKMSADQLVAIMQICPNMETLDCQDNRQLTTGSVDALAKISEFRLNSLRKLDVGTCNITADWLVAIIQVCPNIENLVCSRNSGVAAGFVNALARKPALRLNALRELEVEKCTVTVDQLAAIVQLFTNLEILILSRNRGIGDWFLANQEVRLNGLKRINIKR